MNKICVIGLGYIGLPTAALLANQGFEVVGVDINPTIIETINQGNIHICEPELDKLVNNVVIKGKLKASLKPELADIFIIAVPTPLRDNNQPDISFVETAVKTITPYLKQGNLIILESTIPVGTTEKINYFIKEIITEITPIYLAHCPERVLPGNILKELIENDRVVGGIDEDSTKKAALFYEKFVQGKVISTNSKTAEIVKLTENSFRDINIAFANEMSMICDHLDINVWEVIKLANLHPRVNILKPGPGVGGHCIAIDPWFIVNSSPNLAKLIKTAREVNINKTDYVINQIKNAATKINEPVIACLGLSYKANIDDLRESPALKIVQQLALEKIGKIIAVEPHIKCLPNNLNNLENLELLDLELAFCKANLVVLLVGHNDFINLNQELLESKIIIDTQGIW